MEAWEKDTVTFKFVNLEHRGQRHILSVNGRLFQLDDGKTYTLPRAVLSALKNAVYTRYRIEGHMDEDKTITSFEEERFFAGEVAAPAVPEKMTAKKAAVAAAAEELRSERKVPKPMKEQLEDAIEDVLDDNGE